MPTPYQDRWNRIFGDDTASSQPAPSPNEPPLVQAARLRGMVRGLIAKRQQEEEQRKYTDTLAQRAAEQEEEQRKYSDAMAQRAAELARRERDDQLTAEREDRIARQFRESQRRLEEGDADRLTHQRFLERMAATQNAREAAKAARAEEEAAMVAAERKQWDPVYRAAMGESGSGVTIDPNTFDATTMVDGKPVKLSGRLVRAALKRTHGIDIDEPKSDVDKGEAIARAKYTVGEIFRQSGRQVAPGQDGDLGRALANHPEKIAALAGLLKEDADYDAKAKEYKATLEELEGREFPKSEADQLKEKWFSSLGWRKSDPTVTAITGVVNGTPTLKNVPLSEAKANGYRVVKANPKGGYLLDDQPMVQPTAPVPLLQRADMVSPARSEPSQKTDFDTVEEAEASGLPVGTPITIGGRRAVIE